MDRASAVDNLRKILDRTDPAGFFVRIDMENSAYTQVTLDIFETLWDQGHRQIGVVLQAALHRTEQDLARILALGGRVRLVKGAYKEPKRVAFQHKPDVDAAYARLMKTLLERGDYPAFATHDPAMHALARQWAAERGIGLDRYEFQLLYGVRRDLQASLVAQGHRVRIYIPFGREWFPYFMRRLGERPANIASVVRSVRDEARANRVETITDVAQGQRHRVLFRRTSVLSVPLWLRRRVTIRVARQELHQRGGGQGASGEHDQQRFVRAHVRRTPIPSAPGRSRRRRRRPST